MEREVTRGDTPARSYKIYDRDNVPSDLAGYTIWLTVKDPIEVPGAVNDDAAQLAHYIVIAANGTVTASSGIDLGGIDPDPSSPTYGQMVTRAQDGVITHRLPQADSTALRVGEWVYDLQILDSEGHVITPVRHATFTVLSDVTRRITTP